MSVKLEQLTEDVLALPTVDKVLLAQKVWESLDDVERENISIVDAETIGEALRRDAELSNGVQQGICHEEVMKIARKSLQ